MNEIKILETLKNWGYNKGDFEEIIAKLSSHNEDTISDVAANVDTERTMIYYRIGLTDEGVEMYVNWCQENGYTTNLKGYADNILEFVDENEDSVKNTIEEWGYTEE